MRLCQRLGLPWSSLLSEEVIWFCWCLHNGNQDSLTLLLALTSTFYLALRNFDIFVAAWLEFWSNNIYVSYLMVTRWQIKDMWPFQCWTCSSALFTKILYRFLPVCSLYMSPHFSTGKTKSPKGMQSWEQAWRYVCACCEFRTIKQQNIYICSKFPTVNIQN